MPPIAPPDMPFFSVDSVAGGSVTTEVAVAVVLAGIVADPLDSEDADNDTGSGIVGVAVAWSCAREIGKEDALGLADESEEKVSFSFVSERFATGLSIVDQQTLTWFFVCVHSSLLLLVQPKCAIILTSCTYRDLKQQNALSPLEHDCWLPEGVFLLPPSQEADPFQHTASVAPGAQQ